MALLKGKKEVIEYEEAEPQGETRKWQTPELEMGFDAESGISSHTVPQMIP